MITFTHRFQLRIYGNDNRIIPELTPIHFQWMEPDWTTIVYHVIQCKSYRCIRFSYFSQGQSQLY